MRRAAATIALLTGLATIYAMPRPIANYGRSGGALLPDPRVTPGATLPVDANTVCARGYAGQTRHVTEAEKKQAYAEYAARRAKGVCCEVDHLISLELGGSNDLKNLWPQPYAPAPGAHEKDKLENRLHEMVCAGKIGLPAAQRAIATDWYAAYRQYLEASDEGQLDQSQHR